MNTIYFILTGETEKGANAPLTAAAKKQFAELRDLLPKTATEIWLGEGRRHGDCAKELGLWGSNLKVSAVFGTASSQQNVRGNEWHYLLDTTLLTPDQHTSHADLAIALKAKLQKLPSGSVVCSDVDVLSSLGFNLENVQPATAYKIQVSDRGVIQRPEPLGH